MTCVDVGLLDLRQCCPSCIYITEVMNCEFWSLTDIMPKMDCKTSIRLIVISMLFFLFLSSTMVIADPSNMAPLAGESFN